ncbi:hypothetical protein BG006_003137 [Podila minutissima]|uniref:Uncharacterized protein n=1 Tax=Podila minutissima TaxID=64525 RepID=A0A9P5SS44_9FUNG|nr:hypothetical protein BG006_003137 [Podila minutissima]
MERSFSHLLRTSRLATFDQNIKQIYTTSGNSKRIGDWGLKRNLPTVLRTHFLNIEQLDTAEHQTPFNSASSDYLFLQRWKENFPRSRHPQRQPVAVKKDLATMSEQEFNKLLASAREKRQSWKDALANNEVRSDDHLNYMNIQSRHSRGSSALDTATSQASVGSPLSSSTSSTSTVATGSSRVKVGPTYGFFEPSTPTVVQGRSLGRSKTNQVVGVSGVVATLNSLQSPHLHNASKSLQPYYVYKAELDSDGRPNVHLGLSSPGSGNWLTGGGAMGGRDYYNYGSSSSRHLPQGAASTSSIGMDKKGGKDASDRGVISRVQDLLESRDKPTTRA